MLLNVANVIQNTQYVFLAVKLSHNERCSLFQKLQLNFCRADIRLSDCRNPAGKPRSNESFLCFGNGLICLFIRVWEYCRMFFTAIWTLSQVILALLPGLSSSGFLILRGIAGVCNLAISAGAPGSV